MFTPRTHRARRVAFRAPVAVSDGTSTFQGEVRNISRTGAFVAMNLSIPIDRGISFWLGLPGGPILVRGYVRWTRSLAAGPEAPVGFGMEFYDPEGQLAVALAAGLPGLADRS